MAQRENIENLTATKLNNLFKTARTKLVQGGFLHSKKIKNLKSLFNGVRINPVINNLYFVHIVVYFISCKRGLIYIKLFIANNKMGRKFSVFGIAE